MLPVVRVDYHHDNRFGWQKNLTQSKYPSSASVLDLYPSLDPPPLMSKKTLSVTASALQ